jgi:hypothetical protein
MTETNARKAPNSRRSRRQVPKRSTRVKVYGNPLGLGKNIGVQLLDISETGVRLLLSQEVKIGQECEVNLESFGSLTVKSQATVVWCIPTAEGRFVVGASFPKSINYLALQVLARV